MRQLHAPFVAITLDRGLDSLASDVGRRRVVAPSRLARMSAHATLADDPGVAPARGACLTLTCRGQATHSRTPAGELS